MNEDEVRSALRGVMVASSPPPPMDTRTAVEAGRKAQRRRRATWAGAVAGVAVVGIAAGAALLPGAMSGGGLEAANGGAAPGSASTGAAPSTTGGPDVEASETAWPDGQSDRTATSGPRAAKSVGMVPVLTGAVPPGLTLQGGAGTAAVRTQSQFLDYAADGGQVWEYLLDAPLVKTDGSGAVGTLHVQVTTAGNTYPTGPCEVTGQSWGIKGPCRVVDVGGEQVGLLTSDGSGDQKRFDQLAAYRHDDGTVVFVYQAKQHGESVPALAALPLTEVQLTELATSPGFHVD